ncbi:hypothetical protein [Streptomyces thermodiastaticus]|uniref:hypothetical protein n=1 Tax=Streptomyces thermodiastaticus TaxID=44061 RepID=UPI001672E51D|nr:hypothetical protein [Streptomyces thermodiastaticus]MCE7550899.1 hypothetical protein [Streptomyces thermodiastaticus]GHF73961.1 hypothetical protein GCM10018787_23330 [Streptomyces thermodiastaticus]
MHSNLPVHPLTGRRALGWRKARPGEDPAEAYPIWPILGGAEDDEDGDGDQGDDTDTGDAADDGQGDDAGGGDGDGQGDDDPEGADQLGDPGKKALASMKDKWKAERDKRRELERQLAERDKPADGDNPDPEAIVRQAEAAALAKANERIVRAEVKAAAAGKLADPKDAFRFLDLAQFEVDADGNVDADEIADAIEDLLKTKPYLAAQGGTKRFQGTADSGARKGTGRPPQLTEADVKRLAAAGKHAEILKAREEGRLEDYLRSQ